MEGEKIVTLKEMLTRTTIGDNFIVNLVVIRVNLVGIELIMQEERVLEMVQMGYLHNKLVEEFL